MTNILKITWALIAAITIGLFIYIFKDSEYGAVFFIDMIATLLAEGAIIYSFTSVFSTEEATVQGLSKKVVLTISAIVLFLYNTIISLCFDAPLVPKLLIGDAVILALFFFFYGTTKASTVAIDYHETSLSQQSSVKQNARTSLEKWSQDIEDSLDGDDSDITEDILRNIRSLVSEYSSIPIRKLNDNPEIANHVNDLAANISAGLANIDNAEDKASKLNTISKNVVKLKTYIERQTRI